LKGGPGFRADGDRQVILGRLKSRLDAFDRAVTRLGEIGATLVLTLLVVAASVALHALVRLAQHERATPLALVDPAVEVTLVALPIIVYARATIAELRRSRLALKDLSQRLAQSVEEAEQASKAKSAFLANMSHELRTPLNAILGFSEIMKDEHLGPLNNARYLSYSRDIHLSGRHLLGIINDVLDLAKIEAGKMSLDDAAPFDLVPSVLGAVAMVAGLGEKYGVSLVTDLPDQGVKLVAVERMLRQAVINLVGNAIKFTPAGGRVHVSGLLAPDGSYAVTVRDTGIGMTDKEVANALVPFGQNISKMSGEHQGTGLGLPLAKAMLELHGGSLEIISWPDRGTTITAVLPRARVIKADEAAAA
jgi:signal transduction histidine kinase